MTTNNNTHGILKMLATTNNACNRYLKCLIDITKMLDVMIRRAPEKGEHRKTTEQSVAVVEKKTVAGTKGGRDASIPDARPHAGGDGSHYYRNANLSRLGNPCCPGFPTGNARPGQKRGPFVPVGNTNREKRCCQRHVAGAPFCPGW